MTAASAALVYTATLSTPPNVFDIGSETTRAACGR
jgi:hypothetical protein